MKILWNLALCRKSNLLIQTRLCFLKDVCDFVRGLLVLIIEEEEIALGRRKLLLYKV